ncbi:MAG: hypothetical protein PWP31_1863 [Clostridia bacterium]|nr:hypothetical protein [Clostridia bacterium]
MYENIDKAPEELKTNWDPRIIVFINRALKNYNENSNKNNKQ